MRTGWVPVGTLLAGLVSVGLNLWSIPRYGLAAAPITMAASYAALALIHGGLAHLLCPIRWEYGRWGKVALIGALCYGLAVTLAHGTLAVNMLMKVLVVVVGVPTGLLLVGFVRPAEWQYLRHMWAHARGRS
jgi:hypothetical protein